MSDENDRDRPMPAPGDHPDDSPAEDSYGQDPEHTYVDRDKADFDPEAGLYSGTLVHGGTEVPGKHENVDDLPEAGEEPDAS